jgi:hypothetical protein
MRFRMYVNLSQPLFQLFLLGALITAPLAAQSAGEVGHLDIAVTYNATLSNTTSPTNFVAEGGSLQLHGLVYRGFGVVADISGGHAGNIGTNGVGLDMVTTTFGPRYTLAPMGHRWSVFGQALVGEANGFHSVFPGVAGTLDSTNSLALQLGGGVNWAMSHRIALRALDADWVRTEFPNGESNVQNNLRLGAGVVLHLK